MMQFFLPLVLVGSAIGLFVFYVSPTYQTIKGLQIEDVSYDEALAKARELRVIRDGLLAKRMIFLPADIEKLEKLLPDNVDNIRLIIDISNIASRHRLTLANVDLGDLSKQKTRADTESGSPVGSVAVGFSVSTGSYDDFLNFIQDLEHSLRLVDVSRITFAAPAADATTYAVNIRTYWLH